MRIPAFCDTCGAVFPSGIEGENNAKFVFENTSAGPCPICNHMGHIPDGVFEIIDNAIQIISAPKCSIIELSQLANTLIACRNKMCNSEEISNKIKHEIPEFNKLADILPHTRSELYSFITIAVTIITLIITNIGKKETINITINQAIDKIYKDNDYFKSDSKVVKVGRNGLCPCGSQKKFKKCHGMVNLE